MNGRLRWMLSAIVAVAALVAAGGAVATPGPPLSIAALGGAVSAGACTTRSCVDDRENSWSTGTNAEIRSVRQRLERIADASYAAHPSDRYRGRIAAFTFASRSFRTVADLEAQARRAVRAPWRLATVDLGVGDLCAETPVGVLSARLDRALAILARQASITVDGLDPPVGREILVLSIEDLARHWRVVQSDPVRFGRFRSECWPAARPSARRLAEIHARTLALNDAIARVCFRHGVLYDGGRHFRMTLNASFFSADDPLYLSVAGQRALAAIEWRPVFVLSAAGS